MAAGSRKHGTMSQRSGIITYAASDADADAQWSEAECAWSNKGERCQSRAVRVLSLYLDQARDLYYRVSQNALARSTVVTVSKQHVVPKPVPSQAMNPRTPRYTGRNQKCVDIEEVENAGTGWRKPSAKVYIINIIQGRVRLCGMEFFEQSSDCPAVDGWSACAAIGWSRCESGR